MASRPIIVLGAERSGTSAVAEVIHRWGAYAGESQDLPPPDDRNERGRWEYRPLWDLLALIGDFAGGTSWWDDAFPAFAEGRLEDAEIVGQARALVARMERLRSPWVWKDPALCHFLPFWRGVWKEPVFVITVRNPVDVAHSWQRFALAEETTTTIEGNLLRWQAMMTKVLQDTEGASRRLFLAYEDLMLQPAAELDRLNAFLESACGEPGTPEAMADAVQPRLWRTRSSGKWR